MMILYCMLFYIFLNFFFSFSLACDSNSIPSSLHDTVKISKISTYQLKENSM